MFLKKISSIMMGLALPIVAMSGDTIVSYPPIPGLPLSAEYTLKVNNMAIPVIKVGPSVAIAQFAFSGSANVQIILKQTVPAKYSLSPERIEWNEKVSGNTLSLTLSTPRSVILHYGALTVTDYFNGMEYAEGITEKLFIFAEPLETESPKPGDQNVFEVKKGSDIQTALDAMPSGGTLYISPGIYTNNAINMRSNKRVYVAPGVKLAQGFTFGTIQNARVFGRGAIDLEGESRTGIRFIGAQNCQADDIFHLRRGYGIHVYFQNSRGNSCRGMKLVTDEQGRTGCNTDGYDPNDNCFYDTVSNTFVFNTDDPTAPGWDKSMENYTFKNSVVWNHRCGRALKVGSQTGGNHYSYFDWENIDAIGCQWAIEMTWQGTSGTPTVYHHFYVKNVYIEHLTRSALNMEGSDAYDVYFMNLVLPYFGPRTQGFTSSKITSTTIQQMVVGGKVMQNMAEAKLTYNPSVHKITFRTDKPCEVNIKAASLYASCSPLTPASFVVSRNGGSTEKPLRLLYRIQGCAKNGIDYEKIPGEITIPAGQTAASILITPIANNTKNIKNVLLEIEHVTDTTYMLGSDFQAQISIVSSGTVSSINKKNTQLFRKEGNTKIIPFCNSNQFLSQGSEIKLFSLQGRKCGTFSNRTDKIEKTKQTGIVIGQVLSQKFVNR